MMQREQAYSTVPSQTHSCYRAVTDSEHRARETVPGKAPGGTRDPSGPAWSPTGVPKGTLDFFFISGFAQICVSETNNPFNTFPHRKTLAGIYICNGVGLDLPPNKEVSRDGRAEKGTPAPHHAPYPGRSAPSLVPVPAPDRPLRNAVHPSAGVSQMW